MLKAILRFLFGDRDPDDLSDSEVDTVATNFWSNWKPCIRSHDDDE